MASRTWKIRSSCPLASLKNCSSVRSYGFASVICTNVRTYIYLLNIAAQENIFGNEIENMPQFSKVNCIATLCRSCYSTGSKFCTRDSFFHPSVYISSYIRNVVMSTGHVFLIKNYSWDKVVLHLKNKI